MGAITISSKGNYKSMVKFLNKMSNSRWLEQKLDEFGKMGVNALSNATPVDTGLTAKSWSYEKYVGDGFCRITWLNTNIVHYYSTGTYKTKKKYGAPRQISHFANIAIIIDTGHATRNGGYVVGRHYIEPAIQPVFDEIAEKLWKEVTSS